MASLVTSASTLASRWSDTTGSALELKIWVRVELRSHKCTPLGVNLSAPGTVKEHVEPGTFVTSRSWRLKSLVLKFTGGDSSNAWAQRC